jgi:multisubunit Na+/H+ antiporter MnhE subunit
MSRSGALRHWVGWWLVCVVLWLLLTSTVAPNEVVTGVAAAALAATAATLVRDDRPFAPQRVAGVVRYVAMLPARVAVDTWLLTVALVRQFGTRHGARELGQFREVAVSGSGALFETMSAIVTSVAPNDILVEVDDARRVATVHELVARDRDSLEELLRRP